MRGLRIAFFGSSLLSSFWNGAATYYRGIIRELHARGHRVTFYEPDAYGRQQHRDMEEPEWARVMVYQPGEEDVDRCLEAAAGADLVVKASGVGVFDEYLEKAVLDLKKPGKSIIFWDVDAPATLDRATSDPRDPFRALVPRYDIVLTYGGGDPVVDAYIKLGARSCVPVYNALDPETHYPVAAEPRFAADLGFLGNRLPDREERVDEFFLKAAALAPRKTFLFGGNGWEDKPLPPNVKRVGHVPTADHNSFNCSVRAVLNINRQSMAAYGFSPPTRIFEAAGAGACIITDEWAGIDHFLEPGREIVTARSGGEVADIIEGLGPEAARAVGEAGRRAVLARHTYASRARQLEDVLGI